MKAKVEIEKYLATKKKARTYYQKPIARQKPKLRFHDDGTIDENLKPLKTNIYLLDEEELFQVLLRDRRIKEMKSER